MFILCKSGLHEIRPIKVSKTVESTSHSNDKSRMTLCWFNYTQSQQGQKRTITKEKKTTTQFLSGQLSAFIPTIRVAAESPRAAREFSSICTKSLTLTRCQQSAESSDQIGAGVTQHASHERDKKRLNKL